MFPTKKALIGLVPLLAATAIFARGNDKMAKEIPCGLPVPDASAFNAPAQIAPKCPWNVSGSASFIYWQAIEESLELGDVVYFNPSINLLAAHSIPSQTINFDFKFKPSFKLSLGGSFDYDHWDLFTDYTWYHTGNMTSSISEPGLLNVPTDTFFTDSVIQSKLVTSESFANGYTACSNFLSRRWAVKMDLLDLMLSRSYYVGTQLKFRPSFGPRAAWIRQKMSSLEIGHGPYSANDSFPVGTATSTHNTTTSWGYGLKGALETDWMVGYGIRLFGTCAADILYTNYNLRNSIFTTITGTPAYHSDYQKGAGFLRPHAELEFGLGWGTYFNCCSWYFDLAASYNFQIFWDQNMFLENSSTPLPPYNLYLHGFTFTVSNAF